MIKRLGLGTLVWALLALLAASSLMLTLGRREASTKPDSFSTAPSGAAAFAELLRRQGYQVESIAGARINVSADTLLIGLGVSKQAPVQTDSDDPLISEEHEVPLREPLMRHFRKGGSALLIALPEDFQTFSVNASSNSVQGQPAFGDMGPNSPIRPVTISSAGEDSGTWLSDFPWLTRQSLPVFVTGSGAPLFEIVSVADGSCGIVADGIGITNRFLDRRDNAEFYLNCVRALVRPSARIGFLEAAHGPVSPPTLMGILGPWAETAWWQALLAGAVIVLTLGKRFGLPAEGRSKESGSKDLADALSSLMGRARATDLALGVLFQAADRELRRHLKLPSDAPESLRDARLPADLVQALKKTEVLSRERCPMREAADLARRLESEVSNFLGSPHRPGIVSR